VLLDRRNIETTGPKKLEPKYLGPFPVEAKVGRGAYKLKLPAPWKIHPTINESLLKPYNESKFETQERDTRPPPEIVNGAEEYVVEAIVAQRKNIRKRREEFLVK
jgi:hypothetical protein